MRSERVQTHLRCNQNCTYCVDRRSADDLSWVQANAVRGRIARAVASGAREVVLTGGEPTLRADLPALVGFARDAGAERVTLETNATRMSAGAALDLAAVHLDRAVVNLTGHDDWIDGVTRDPGGFDATVRGIDALLSAGIDVDVQAVVVRSTAERLPLLPPMLRKRFESVRTLFLSVPVRSPDRSELLDYDSAARTIRATEASARAAGLPLKLAPGSGPPPCVHGREPRVAHLYALTPGAPPRPSHRHLEPCDECIVRDRCSGISIDALDHFGPPQMTPVTAERVRRRLSLIATVEEQIARELVQPNRRRDPARGDVDEDIIRIVFQCNQSCTFCFVSTHLPMPSTDAVEDAIRAAAARGRVITLSGGEPTLHPELPRLVRLARSLSTEAVVLQTNALRLCDGRLAEELAEAGLDEVFVSLHGATADVSDEITRAPGTFEKTLRGLDAIHATGVRVEINFVICRANAHELPAWVELLATRWPGAHGSVSFVAPSTDLVPRTDALIPRYTDVVPFLAEAVSIASARGVELDGLDGMCGIPLCLVPSSLDSFLSLSEIPPGFDAGEFVKPEPCSGCALESRCWGLRRGYAELHGHGELRPVEGPARVGAEPMG